jgi:hypothetical protein
MGGLFTIEVFALLIYFSPDKLHPLVFDGMIIGTILLCSFIITKLDH